MVDPYTLAIYKCKIKHIDDLLAVILCWFFALHANVCGVGCWHVEVHVILAGWMYSTCNITQADPLSVRP